MKTTNNKFALAFLATILFLPALLTLAEEKAALVEATDQKAIEANLDKEVTVTGTISEARWSPKGNILFIKFEGNKLGDFEAIAKKENREALDKAFDGDIAKALIKSKVNITGKITKFKDRKEKESLQLEVTAPTQITILKKTTTAPKP